MKKITILITDDHTLIRQAWSHILNADPRFEVIAEAGSGEEAIEKSKRLRPNVVLMDINLPGLSGIETIPLIRKCSPCTKILGVSMYSQPAYVRAMLKQGAMGYITKNSSVTEVYTALIELQNNRRYICEEVKSILAEQMACGGQSADGFNMLSKREIEIIGLIRKGYSSREIAESLEVSFKTVEVHRFNILKKLKVKNSAEKVNYISRSQLGAEIRLSY